MKQSELKKHLHYNHETGIFTRFINVSNVKSGDIAGSPHNAGYIHIQVKGKKYLAHRLAFLYMEGKMPEQVDHINHQRDDNRWLNLRPATNKINQKNMSLYSNNKSGYTGVHWDKAAKKWMAKIQIKRKTIYLGYFINLEEAIKARKQANTKYKFHANHGSL